MEVGAEHNFARTVRCELSEEADAFTGKSGVHGHAARSLLASELVGPPIAHDLEGTEGMGGWWFTPEGGAANPR